MTASRIVVGVVILAVLTAAGGAAQVDDSGNVTKLLALENVWRRALAEKSLNALDALLNRDFVYVDPKGRTRSKAEVLADVQSAKNTKLAETMIVRLHGEIAVVTGLYQEIRDERGKALVDRGRFVDTWYFSAGRWTAIASVATPMEGPL